MKSNLNNICFLSIKLNLIFVFRLRNKRSPYLRLDELSTRLYLQRNKLGGGFIDPLEM